MNKRMFRRKASRERECWPLCDLYSAWDRLLLSINARNFERMPQAAEQVGD